MVSSHPLIFDRRLLRQRRARAAALGPATFLIERVAEDLSDRLATVLRRCECAVDLGTPSDAVRAVLAASGKVGTIVAADALFSLPHMQPSSGLPELGHSIDRRKSETSNFGREGAQTRVEVVAADEEALPFRDAALDLVVSALALQFVNDLPGTLVQIRRALKPDGLLLAALIGGDTLIELRQAFASAEAEIEDGISPRIIPFADVREMGGLLQRAGFALPVTDVDRLTVRYDSAIALMHDLRRMGATNPLIERSRRPLGRATVQRMTEVYAERFADGDGRIRATFEIVWLSGWAPHASQQKPLAPGSARLRLADALGTKELPLPRGGKRSSDSEDG
jgi:SAM-dependent methyltransferase